LLFVNSCQCKTPAFYCDGIFKHLPRRVKCTNVLADCVGKFWCSVHQTNCIYRSIDFSFEFYDLGDLTDWTASVDDTASNNLMVRDVQRSGLT